MPTDALDLQPMAFCDDPLDRADTVRKDADAVAKARRDTHVLLAPMWRGQVFALEAAAPSAALLNGASVSAGSLGPEVFLGFDDGAPVFAVNLDPEREPGGAFPLTGMGAWTELRAMANVIDRRDASVFALARSVLDWHARHGFCARCGHPTDMTEGGWKRACASCGAEHFPRVDPVVIMLITYEDRTLLGRQAAWPDGMFSCLAGFVEPGETLEAAVRREAMEEAKTPIGAVSYRASQPWPFPSSLMIGVTAEALEPTAEADGIELEAARWFTRQEAADLVADTHKTANVPPGTAIATHLIADWVADRTTRSDA